MEFGFRSRPTTAAADDEENGRLRRFPDPPPPQPQPHGHGDTNSSGVDAALLMRRQELMLELHKAFIHQDMILRELVETERAMGLTTGSHNPVPALPRSLDYWSSSVPSWEAPLKQPFPCGCGRSTVVRAPPVSPVYPHVERSLHAPEQTRSGNDAEQRLEGRSSGVRTHPFNDYFELCHSPSKQTPVAGKAGINHMQPSSGHQQAIVWEKFGVEYVDNMQPLHEIKNQSSEGRKAIYSGIDDCIKKPMQQRLQYKPADQEHAANNEQKSTGFNEPTPEGTSAGVKRKLSTPSSPVKKQMVQQTIVGSRTITTNARQDVEEEAQPENRWTCTLCQAKCNTEADYRSHLGGRRHRERLYCGVCEVQCNSEKMLASHLGGRRHRQALEGSDSD